MSEITKPIFILPIKEAHYRDVIIQTVATPSESIAGPNTLRRYLYIMGLSNNPTCRKCGTEEETSVHILCECEALASLRHTHLGSFFLYPENIKKLRVEAIWNFAKGTELL